jgi:hypothetical protein
MGLKVSRLEEGAHQRGEAAVVAQRKFSEGRWAPAAWEGKWHQWKVKNGVDAVWRCELV